MRPVQRPVPVLAARFFFDFGVGFGASTNRLPTEYTGIIKAVIEEAGVFFRGCRLLLPLAEAGVPALGSCSGGVMNRAFPDKLANATTARSAHKGWRRRAMTT